MVQFAGIGHAFYNVPLANLGHVHFHTRRAAKAQWPYMATMRPCQGRKKARIIRANSLLPNLIGRHDLILWNGIKELSLYILLRKPIAHFQGLAP